MLHQVSLPRGYLSCQFGGAFKASREIGLLSTVAISMMPFRDSRRGVAEAFARIGDPTDSPGCYQMGRNGSSISSWLRETELISPNDVKKATPSLSPCRTYSSRVKFQEKNCYKQIEIGRMLGKHAMDFGRSTQDFVKANCAQTANGDYVSTPQFLDFATAN